MFRRRVLALVSIAVLALGSACAPDTDDADIDDADTDVSFSLGTVPDSVEGNVVEIPVEVENFDVVKADGDTSGETGHFHIFIDREPTAEGEVIPREAGVVHSAENPIMLYGLDVGEHEFAVVLGDGAHERIHGEHEEAVTVEVEGPSVDASAPATAKEGEDVTVEFEAEGVEIKAADGDTSGESGHFHVLVDPEEAPAAGEVIPEAEEGKIYHTPESSLEIADLAKGEHTIWVVVGDGTHEAFDPPVMDKLTVTVE